MTKKLHKNDTEEGNALEEAIAAIATGHTRSAIGVIRLSGEGCIQALARVFMLRAGGSLETCQPGKLTLGTLVDGEGNTLDHALAVLFRAPHSYTGEDAAELHCHGSPTVLALALEALFAQGVRQAGPGEFTRRAFLNGKLDLMEAEGVADLIDAQSPAAVRQAAAQLGGALSARVAVLYDGLLDLMAHFHATLDYPDEDLAPFTPQTVSAALDAAAAGLSALLATYDRGRYIKDGVPTAIVGRPNVGKSTLLNALVGYERAIVTDIPGTTRDTVEERCVLGGALLRLVDTAGLRPTDDPVEKLGVERSQQAMAAAALVLVLQDLGRELDEEDAALAAQAGAAGRAVLLLDTKADLYGKPPRPGAIAVSAKTGQGLDQLAQAVARLFPQGGQSGGEVLLTNLRQAQAARRALEAVERARAAHNAGVTPDFLLTDVEEALAALGELSGRNVREDTVARIFERFCVGK